MRLPFPENDQTHRDSGSRKRQERTVQRKEDSNNKGKMKEDAEEESSRSSDSRDNAAGNADSADRNVSNGSQRGKESGDPSPLCSKEENEKVLLSTSSAKEEIPRRSHKKRQGQGGRHRGSVWILLGILLISAALCMTAYNLLEERRADAAIDQAASALDAYYEEQASTESGGSEDSEAPVDSEKEAEERKELEELLADRDMPTVTIDGEEYIGELSVPSLNLKLPILAEYAYEKLNIAPCRYSGTVYRNDMVLAGHNYARHFSPLRYLAPGAEIDFTDAEHNRYQYEITSIEILQPTQLNVLLDKDDGDWDLSLFTCSIGGRTRHVIRCSRIEQSAGEESSGQEVTDTED